MAKVQTDNQSSYVYCLLDPRKPGNYTYGKYRFEYLPFYVGKGTGNRGNVHVRPSQWQYNTYKGRIIAKLKRLDMKPIVHIVKSDIGEDRALRLEQRVIKIIGRADVSKGPLSNRCDGGEGCKGAKWTKAKKRAHSRLLSRKWKQLSEERKAERAMLASESQRQIKLWHDRVAKNNPKLVVVGEFISQNLTPSIDVRLPCGCVVTRNSKRLQERQTVRSLWCFKCEFGVFMKANHPGFRYKPEPQVLMDEIKFKCPRGHVFRQEARAKWLNTHKPCPRCPEPMLKALAKRKKS